MTNKLYARVRAIIASDKFFYAVVALLVAQAAWIALSGRYPMAYDEQNHLGIIRIYASHVSPFWSGKLQGAAPYNDVTRDPSYLYQWLLSFVYRFISLFLKTDGPQVLVFRFISIGLFAWALAVYRKVLLRAKASKAMVHTVLAVFVLTPTVPFLAGQMNYDNLLFLLVAAMLLLTINIVATIKAGRLDSRQLLLFAAGGMLTSLVKFPFLAILLPLAVWIAVVYWRTQVRHGYRGWRHGVHLLGRSFASIARPARIGLVALTVVAAVMFAERYGVNMVRYHTPTPECDQVLDADSCMAFGPWKRNHDIYQSRLAGALPPVRLDAFSFTFSQWLGPMVWQFFYALNGPVDNFSVGQPLPLPYYLGMAVAVAGLVLLIVHGRQVFQRPMMKGLGFVAVFYVFVLWAQNYADFLHLHVATAIQARYVVLVLPILYLGLALAYARALRRVPAAKAALAVVVIGVLLTQGGGIGVFIIRSNPLWWWQNPTVVEVNQAAQRVLRPVVVGS